MEPAELFAPGVGLAVHSRSGIFRDGAPTAICGMVLPRAGEIQATCWDRLGCVRGWCICDLRGRRRRWIWFSDLGRGCGERAGGRGTFFARVARHGFPLEKGELVPCRDGCAVRLRSTCCRSAPKRGRLYRGIRRCTPFARGKFSGAPTAPEADALDRDDHHARGRVADDISCPGRDSRTDATLRRRRIRPLCGRGGATARCSGLLMVCPVSDLASHKT